MITRKATIGFILLALIVFPTAYFSWDAPLPAQAPSTVRLSQIKHMDNSVREDLVYRPPVIQTSTPMEMAVIVTVIIELFTFLCYLVLKRVEPYIVALEKSERERIQKRNI